jgi:hypothetical protein
MSSFNGSGFSRFLPWVLLIVVAIARDQMTSGLKKVIDAVSASLYRSLAGTRLMRRAALVRYLREVHGEYKSFRVPFTENMHASMRDVYIPLSVTLPSSPLGAGAEAQNQDAGQAISSGRSVVVGVPGAGKSMLLRHTAYFWAAAHCTPKPVRRAPGRKRSAGPAPVGDQTPEKRLKVRLRGLSEVVVLVELKRLNGKQTELRDEIVAVFDRRKFPKADRFIARELGRGRLTVLLDGLDEVAAERLPGVVEHILEFAEQHHGSRIIVTCREAVYRGQLRDQFDRLVKVVEFDERLMQRFLRAWPGLDKDSRFDRLMSALASTPRLAQLARNPLLASMIAYVYTYSRGDLRTLPHTRAEFYRHAVALLLGSDLHHEVQYDFDVGHKREVLLRLALLAHKGRGSDDGLTLTHETVLAETKATFRHLDLDPARAKAMLDEIVARSGLLLRIDDGTRYQFAHLTLQEYLSAVALLDQREQLLDLYDEGRGARWREVVRLWCGAGSQDSTDVIAAIRQTDEILAFECLAEAKNVQQDLAESIITELQAGLREDPQVITSFGLVASDRTMRGRNVLRFLIQVLAEEPESGRGRAAAAALAATHLPEAAPPLLAALESAPNQMEQLVALVVALGDITVLALAERGTAYLTTTRILGLIGTPAAAAALARRLTDDGPGAVVAARYLAGWLDDAEVLAQLREPTLAAVAARLPPERLDWVWTPFEEQGDAGQLTLLVGRIAWLIARRGEWWKMSNVPAMSMRIGLPLVAVDDAIPLKPEDRFLTTNSNLLAEIAKIPVPVKSLATEIAEPLAIEELSTPIKSLKYIMLAMNLRIPLSGFYTIITRSSPPSAWQRIRELDSDYEFDEGWHSKVIVALGLSSYVCAGFAAVENGLGRWRETWTWFGWVGLALPVLALIIALSDGFLEGPRDWFDSLWYFDDKWAPVHVFSHPMPIKYLTDYHGALNTGNILTWLGMTTAIPVSLFFDFEFVAHLTSSACGLATAAALAAAIALLKWHGLRSESSLAALKSFILPESGA